VLKALLGKGSQLSGRANGLVVDPDEMAVVADEHLVGPGRPDPAAQFLARDPAAADADLDGDGPGRGRSYGHGT
jgi:hypothetical protein